MTALPVVEHLDILEAVLLRFVPRGVVPMVHELALQRPEKAFDAGIVPAGAFAAHAGGDAVLAEQMLGALGGVLGGFKWSSQPLDEGGCDDHSKAAFGSVWAATLAVTRSTAGGRRRGAATVLGGDRGRHGQ